VLACVLHYVEQQIALEDKTTSKAIVEIRTLSVATIRQFIAFPFHRCRPVVLTFSGYKQPGRF
jgi:hypothetical protein